MKWTSITLFGLLTSPPALSQATPVWIRAERELGPLDSLTSLGYGGDGWGTSMAVVGDVDGDGIDDLAVGAPGAQIQFTLPRIWIAFLDEAGRVRDTALAYQGGLGGEEGSAVEGIGDFDGDGVPDVASGSDFYPRTTLHLLRPEGGAHTTIPLDPPPTAVGSVFSTWGSSIANVGDLDGNGTVDLAIGEPRELGNSSGAFCVSGVSAGRVWIHLLNADGSLKELREIDASTPLLAGELEGGDLFGVALEALGDLDGDGTLELAVGASGDDDGGPERGAVWILSLAEEGEVVRATKISSTRGGFRGALEDRDFFSGSCAYDGSLSAAGDLNGDEVRDLIVGAPGDDLGGADLGAVWVLFLGTDGSVVGEQELSATTGGLTIPQTTSGGASLLFTSEVLAPGDLDGDGWSDLLVSAPRAPSTVGGPSSFIPFGAVYVLSLGPGPVAAVNARNAGTNPDSYRALPPRIGRTWQATVDLTTSGHREALVFGFESPSSVTLGNVTLGNGQTLLALDAGSGAQLATEVQPGPLASFSMEIPNAPSLLGLRLATQALHVGDVVPFALSNAQDLLVGLPE